MRRKHFLLYLLVFSAGFSSMSVELASVRALAPYFGASVFVWTNVLGIVLAALSLGYFVAGKLADRWNDARALAKALVAGAGLAFAAPYLAQLLATAFLPNDLRLEDSFAIFWGGSLGVGLLAFGPAAFLLSFTAPAAIRFLAVSRPVGEVSGRVFALSTVGSILGTFLTTYCLVPSFGTRATFAVAAFAVLIPALLLLLSSDKVPSSKFGAWLIIIPWLAGAGGAAEFAGRPTRSWGLGSLVEERETLYQFVQLREQGSENWLQVNEGVDSFQSYWSQGKDWTGAYYDFFLLAPALAERPSPAPLRVCILGLGGGTASRLLEIHEGGRQSLEIDGVEIDEDLLALAKRPFGLDTKTQPHLRVIGGLDARVFLQHTSKRYDVILLDSYAAQMHIPFHLASREFFALVSDKLEEGGVLAMNVGLFRDPGRAHDEDATLQTIAATAACVFGEVRGVPVPRSRNIMLFCRKAGAMPTFEGLYDSTRENAPIRRLLSHAAFPGVAKTWMADSGVNGRWQVLTDDLSPLERIQLRSLAMGGER